MTLFPKLFLQRTTVVVGSRHLRKRRVVASCVHIVYYFFFS